MNFLYLVCKNKIILLMNVKMPTIVSSTAWAHCVIRSCAMQIDLRKMANHYPPEDKTHPRVL